MIHTCGYLVIEKSDEFQFSQIKGAFHMCGSIIKSDNLPKHFPMCYRRKVEILGSHICGSWVPCDIQECIEEYESFITMHQNQLKKVKEEFENERS
jgi:hypothetical protein